MSSEVTLCIKTQPTPDNEQKELKGLNTQTNKLRWALISNNE